MRWEASVSRSVRPGWADGEEGALLAHATLSTRVTVRIKRYASGPTLSPFQSNTFPSIHLEKGFLLTKFLQFD